MSEIEGKPYKAHQNLPAQTLDLVVHHSEKLILFHEAIQKHSLF